MARVVAVGAPPTSHVLVDPSTVLASEVGVVMLSSRPIFGGGRFGISVEEVALGRGQGMATITTGRVGTPEVTDVSIAITEGALSMAGVVAVSSDAATAVAGGFATAVGSAKRRKRGRRLLLPTGSPEGQGLAISKPRHPASPCRARLDHKHPVAEHVAARRLRSERLSLARVYGRVVAAIFLVTTATSLVVKAAGATRQAKEVSSLVGLGRAGMGLEGPCEGGPSKVVSAPLAVRSTSTLLIRSEANQF